MSGFYKCIIILFLTFGCSGALAKSQLSVGTSLSYLNINDPDFKYKSDSDQLQLSSLNIGFNKVYDNKIVAGVQTNRLINKAINRRVINKSNGLEFTNNIQVKTDALTVGKLYKKWLPSIFIAHASIKKSLIGNAGMIAKTQQNTFLGGLNITYFYDNKFSLSSAILLPNRDFNIDSGVILSVRYNFNFI